MAGTLFTSLTFSWFPSCIRGAVIVNSPQTVEIEIAGNPRIMADAKGTDKVEEVLIVRDGAVIRTVNPGGQEFRLEFVDDAFPGNSFYYLRAIQADKDEHGNRSHAWSSPIWVQRK